MVEIIEITKKEFLKRFPDKKTISPFTRGADTGKTPEEILEECNDDTLTIIMDEFRPTPWVTNEYYNLPDKVETLPCGGWRVYYKEK